MNNKPSSLDPTVDHSYNLATKQLFALVNAFKKGNSKIEDIDIFHDQLLVLDTTLQQINKVEHLKVYRSVMEILGELHEVLSYLAHQQVWQLVSAKQLANYTFVFNTIIKKINEAEEITLLYNLEQLRLQPSPSYINTQLEKFTNDTTSEYAFTHEQIESSNDKLADYIKRIANVTRDNKYAVTTVSLFYEKAGINLKQQDFINLYVASFIYYLGNISLASINLLTIDSTGKQVLVKVGDVPF